MRFAAPYFFLGFLAVAALIGFYLWAMRQRKAALGRFAQQELLKELLASFSPQKQKIRIYLIIGAVLMSVIALMRPQGGFHWQEVKRRGVDILVALDTSKSMLTEDIKPDRLQRSKLALRDLTRKLKGDRIGLIAFAGSAFLECPLTVDYSGFLLTLEDVDVDSIPRGGTSLTSAIREAIKSYRGASQKYKVLVLITDGEDHEGDAMRAAVEAKNAGITIFTIGIGTREGDLIFVEENGGKEFLKDASGNAVKSRLNEEVLEKIALTTGGTYIRSTPTEFGLDLLFEQKLSKLEKQEFQSKMSKQYEERFQWPLALALVLLLAELLIRETK